MRNQPNDVEKRLPLTLIFVLWLVFLAFNWLAYNFSPLLGAGISFVAGIAIIWTDLANKQRFLRETRTSLFSALESGNLDPDAIEKILENAPVNYSLGSEFKVASSAQFDASFEALRSLLSADFFTPISLDVYLVALPSQSDRRTPVGIYTSGKLLGFVPDEFSGEIFRSLISKAGAMKTKGTVIFAVRMGLHVCQVRVPKKWTRH